MIDEDIKEFYIEEIKSIFQEIEGTVKSFYHLDYYEEVGDEITDEIEKACDSLYESERHLYNALKLLKGGE